MDKSILVKIFEHPAIFIHGDLSVVDRWLWLKDGLLITKDKKNL